MSINNKLLSGAIEKSVEKFEEYFWLIYQQGKLLEQFYSENKNEALFEKISNNEKLIDQIYDEFLQSTEWQISQQNPVTSSLRFFITILLSSKDLERCGDYVFDISKILHNNEEQRIIHDLFETRVLWKKMLEHFEKIGKILFLARNKLGPEDFEKIVEIKGNFNGIFKDYCQKINTFLSSHLNQKSEKINIKKKSFIAHICLISVKTDRMMDHIFNVAENFYSINHQKKTYYMH